MRKPVSRVVISTYTLQETPDCWQTGKEAKEHTVIGVALCRIFPIPAIYTEEYFELRHGICLAAVHVSKEEVSEFNRIDSSEEKSEIAEAPPFSSMIV